MPNANTGLVNTGELPACNNACDITLMHEKITYLPVVPNRVSSIKRYLFVLLNKFEHIYLQILLCLLWDIPNTSSARPLASSALLLGILMHMPFNNVQQIRA